MSLLYKTFYLGPSYSSFYNSYNFCDRRNMFATLNLPVNCLFGSWYCDLKYAFKVYHMNDLKRNQCFYSVCWLVGFVALRPKSTAMVIAG